MPERKSVTVGKPENGNTAQFHFDDFTFSQAGTYVYNVRERNAGTTTDGMTHDGRTAIASFTVVASASRTPSRMPTRLSRSTACQTVWNSRSS